MAVHHANQNTSYMKVWCERLVRLMPGNQCEWMIMPMHMQRFVALL